MYTLIEADVRLGNDRRVLVVGGGGELLATVVQWAGTDLSAVAGPEGFVFSEHPTFDEAVAVGIDAFLAYQRAYRESMGN